RKSGQLAPKAGATRLPDFSYAAVAHEPEAWMTDRRVGACGMTGLAAPLRFMFGALGVALCAPALAQAPLVDLDASVVNEQTLLREAVKAAVWHSRDGRPPAVGANKPKPKYSRVTELGYRANPEI